jgi:hypothetical protein
MSGLGFCVLFAVGMSYVAYTNQKGLQLFRFLNFSVGQASAIYWGLAFVLLVAAILFCVLLARNSEGPISIVLNETAIVAPAAALKSKLLSIPYTSIQQVLF